MGSSTYSEEFKKEAVRRLWVGGKSANDLSKELGVPQTTLSRWYRKASDRGEITSQDLVHGEELRRLRKENERLRMERDILKKRRPSSPTSPSEVPLYRGEEGVVPHPGAVLYSSGFSEWLLRLARTAGE